MHPWWQQVLESVGSDFTDLPDLGRMAQLALRLIAAVVLGGLLGYERAHAGKAAGIRTHMLVALGAALFVVLPQQAGADEQALSRVIQGLIAGIGFLGGGAILKISSQGEVHGLTTAAGIWLTAAIGVAVGTGRIVSAILATMLAWVVLSLVPHFERRAAPNGGRPAHPPAEVDGESARQ
jgi:putative Mg2+ transporter-C (MgtC) family protein